MYLAANGINGGGHLSSFLDNVKLLFVDNMKECPNDEDYEKTGKKTEKYLTC